MRTRNRISYYSNPGVVTHGDQCNSWVSSCNMKDLIILVPKVDVKNFFKQANIDMDIYLNEAASLFYNISILNSDEINLLKNVSDNQKENNVFFNLSLPNYKSQRHRYYAFCYVRHLYYYETYLISYFTVIQALNKLEYELNYADKVAILGLLHYNTGYSMVNGNSRMVTITSRIFKGDDPLTQSNSSIFTSLFIASNFNNSNINQYLASIMVLLNIMKSLAPNNDTISIDRQIISYGLIASVNPINSTSVKIELNDFIIDNLLNKTEPKLKTLYYTRFMGTNIPAGNRFNSILRLNNSSYHSIIDNTPVVLKPIKVLSRHPSHKIFRGLESGRSVLIRFGSKTEVDESQYSLVINPKAAIEISSNKRLMKQTFVKHQIRTTKYFDITKTKEGDYLFKSPSDPKSVEITEIPYPLILKNIHGSRGTGNYKCDDPNELVRLLNRRPKLEDYIIEEFANYNKEYRIHVCSRTGVFLVWRKVRRNDTPADQKWFFNNQNCNWLSHTNKNFDMPTNMTDIYSECIKALTAVGLTFGAFDVRVQENKNKEGKFRRPAFSIIEVNSAPAMAEVTGNAYINEIKKLI